MHAIAYLMKRKPGLSREEFERRYAEHGAVMARAAVGLLSYTQYPGRAMGVGDVYTSAESQCYDALSVYVFASAECAAQTTLLPEVIADSESFIDFASMITLPVTPRQVV